MSSAVAELDNVLQSMLHQKPPGVSGSKINALTSLCTANIQSESVLVGKIYTHFKKAPGTHKLGVLYVVDSVTRQWVDQARKSGQQVGPGATDGTFAAGVNRVTELLPSLMTDIINSAPDDQKPKIKKLVEIWERSSTFPGPMLSSIKSQLDAAPSNNAESTTPINSPAPGFVPLGQAAANSTPAPAAAPQQNPSSILEALKAMAAKQTSNAPAPPVSAAAAPNNFNALLGVQNGTPQSTTPVNQGQAQNSNPLAALFGGMANGAQPQASQAAPPNPLAALFPQQQQQQQAPALPTPAQVGPDAQATLQLVQLMAQQGIPPDQWAAALQVLNAQKGALPFPPPPISGQHAFGQPPQSRDRDGLTRSPQNGRRRSRSPDYGRRGGRPGSPGFDRQRNGSDGRNGRRGNEYRQRSPDRRRRSPSPQNQTQDLPAPGEKFIEWDHNLPKDTIKVMSRTLFVGGVTSSEAHLRSLFAKFGIVQTCIVNVDKRHAFVKMLNRKDAEAARHGMEEYRDGSTQLRTKWGVGFGPRDCSDYQTGVSIIPTYRLTDADRKWMVSAEYGGTGGKPIQEGMVVEEPDIEIGAGQCRNVSPQTKAADVVHNHPIATAQTTEADERERGGRRDRYRDDERPGSSSGNPNNMPLPFPNMMGANMGNMAGMNFPMMPNGMPMLPPGFNPFAFQQQNQNQDQDNQKMEQ
ncbi:hypothetical protein PMZ80_006284 [Knufia obscura]|uniref:RNA binding protein Nrd1 n=1 Tax=Knufia obscura TaxID=1635080 RepID=A0ABR0RK73_9EURO|nr:hypothetical protein PMZ80_006284 [Knufia obscura]